MKPIQPRLFFHRSQTNTDQCVALVAQQQADFVDREILTQQLLLAYIRDVRNLETFIHPDVLKKLYYSTDANHLWEFCSSIPEVIEDGVYNGRKKKKLYLGLVGNGLFSCLSFVDKLKRITVLQALEWVDNVNFTLI